MASNRTPRVPSRSNRSARTSVVDEWGIYDPAQAGLAALFERLDEKDSGIDELDAKAIVFSIANANKLTSQ
jgi:hypothetical protein